jgi:hypothetical protein
MKVSLVNPQIFSMGLKKNCMLMYTKIDKLTEKNKKKPIWNPINSCIRTIKHLGNNNIRQNSNDRI